MKRQCVVSILVLFLGLTSNAQKTFPFDTSHWTIQADQYVIEKFENEEAIYLNRGLAILKDVEFLNGTIEFDVFLKDRRGFPGVRFRISDDSNMELFYFRPHLSARPDGNQATPVFNGLTAWQLYFGPTYSFPYEYKFNQWTHVKLVVEGKNAQIYLDHAHVPTFSWKLKQANKPGKVAIGSSVAPFHFANVKVNERAHEIQDFNIKSPKPIEGLVDSWFVSDKFAEVELDQSDLKECIGGRKWLGSIQVEENNAANISRVVSRPTGDENTVFAKITINSIKRQEKLFEFGYSDRVVVILNGKRIYKGDNGFRTRDYRYLGTIGFFDSVFLDLKEGKNELLLAVSETFGGWGVTGRFENDGGIQIE